MWLMHHDPDKHTIQRHLLLALFTAFEAGDATGQRSVVVVALDEAIHQFRTWLVHSMTLARWVRNSTLVKTLSKNVRVIPATIHMLFEANTCCRTMAITMSCAMQRSVAMTNEAQMWSRNACETTVLDAMKAKPRMTCKTGVGEDGSIDGYFFIFLDWSGDRKGKLRNEEGVEGCTCFYGTVTDSGGDAQHLKFYISKLCKNFLTF